MKKQFKPNAWRVWAKSLGVDRAGQHIREQDRIAVIRTAIVGCWTIANLFIIASVIRHW